MSSARPWQADSATGFANTSENSGVSRSAQRRNATDAQISCAIGSSSGWVAAAARNSSVAALSISKATRSTSSW